jgi:hypothetical protein
LRLEEGNRSHVTNGELVRDAIAVGICIDTEQFLRLNSHVLVHPFICELTKRNRCTILMEWPDDKVWTDAPNSSRIDRTVLVCNDVSEVDAFGYEMCRHISRRQKSLIDGGNSNGLQFTRHLERERLDRAGAEKAYRHTFIHDFGIDRFP